MKKSLDKSLLELPNVLTKKYKDSKKKSKEDNLIIDLYNQGFNKIDIKEKTKCDSKRINKVLKEYNSIKVNN